MFRNMAIGNINFNTMEVVNACKKMNTARRNIISQLNNMKSTYGSVTLQLWSGSTRQYFHEKVFGIDGESGYVGKLGNGQGGLCKGLNDLLYSLANYVCNVVNKDAEYMKKYAPLNTSLFVDDSVSITPVSGFIDYSSIDTNSIILSPDVISGIEERYNSYFNAIRENINNFNNALNNCTELGIRDASVDGLRKVTSVLNKLIEEFNGELHKLLTRNSDVMDTASKENAEASSRNSEVASILSGLDISFE